MRKQKPYYVLTFRTTAEAMAMEQKCGEQHIPGRLIPVPREITAGCGLEVRRGVPQYVEHQTAIAGLGVSCEQSVRRS